MNYGNDMSITKISEAYEFLQQLSIQFIVFAPINISDWECLGRDENELDRYQPFFLPSLL